MTVKEAAYRLQKTADTIYRWLNAGRLRGWQPGGNRCPIMVCKASVEDATRMPAGTRRESRAA